MQLLLKGDRHLPFGLRWDDDPTRAVLDWTVEYLCEGCGGLIDERHKPAMLSGGEWRAAHPERSVIGFHLNALYSPWMRWVEIVAVVATVSPARRHIEFIANGHGGSPSVHLNGYE